MPAHALPLADASSKAREVLSVMSTGTRVFTIMYRAERHQVFTFAHHFQTVAAAGTCKEADV